MLKKKLLLIIMFLAVLGNSQVLDPISFSGKSIGMGENEYDFVLTVKSDKGWHIYSTTPVEDGPLPTEITWKGDGFKSLGSPKEGKNIHSYFDEIFEMNITTLGNGAEIVQRAKVPPGQKSFTAEVTYQACEDGRCLAPTTKTVSFAIPESKQETNATVTEDKQPEEEIIQTSEISEKKDSIKPSAVITAIKDSTSNISKDNDKKNNQETPDDIKEKKRSNWSIFLAGFLGGFAALLMPCVFPIIPMTVSYFTKKSGSRSKGITNALLYGFFIILIYVGLGLLVTILFGANALNEFATNPWVNIAFFLIFLFFALSFFGAYEIVLPSSWVNASDKASDKGGVIGIFFMAFTLALVSFSCTGPIIGTLLVDAAQSGDRIAPAIGMFGFSLALSLPFTLFALFPNLLQNLPRSGSWMNTVKITLGFIELAFALKFLSNADLVWQNHWLEREYFMAIWTSIFLGLTLYLFGMFRMEHDSDQQKIGTFRLMMALFALTISLYSLPGIWGAPLKIFSGLVPPSNYAEAPNGFSGGGESIMEHSLPPGAHLGPQNIPVFHDYDEGVAYAKSLGKPILLDFTGYACANCRKMEDKVWSHLNIKNILTNNLVVISLYVDERKDLPENEVYESDLVGTVNTVGKKWTEFQIKNFNSNSQPLYVVQDYNMNRMNEVIGTEYDIDVFENWLNRGIEEFNARKK